MRNVQLENLIVSYVNLSNQLANIDKALLDMGLTDSEMAAIRSVHSASAKTVAAIDSRLTAQEEEINRQQKELETANIAATETLLAKQETPLTDVSGD